MPQSFVALSGLKRNWELSTDPDSLQPMALQSSHREMLEVRKPANTSMATMNFDRLIHPPTNYAGENSIDALYLKPAWETEGSSSPLRPLGSLFRSSSPNKSSLSPTSPTSLLEAAFPPSSSLRLEELEALSRMRIEMPRPVEGSKLGVAVTDLEVMAVTKPESEAYGWRVGDKIVTVNGTHVRNQEEFDSELQKAMEAYHSHLVPLVFSIQREHIIPELGSLG